MSDVAVVTTHWNPMGFSRPTENYYIWRSHFKEHDVFCLEMVLGDGDKKLTDSIPVHGNNRTVMWQKERLTNKAIYSLPPEKKWVVWIDADLVFKDENWLERAVDKMEKGMFDAMQLCSHIHYLGKEYQTEYTKRTATSVLWEGGIPDSCPGGAWIANREWFESIGGLYDRSIVGGGDAIFYSAVCKARTKYITRLSKNLQEDAFRYIDRVKCRWGFLEGEMFHLWHGSRTHRQYISRDSILQAIDYDPNDDVFVNDAGLLEFSPHVDRGTIKKIKGYFYNRREDG